MVYKNQNVFKSYAG